MEVLPPEILDLSHFLIYMGQTLREHGKPEIGLMFIHANSGDGIKFRVNISTPLANLKPICAAKSVMGLKFKKGY